MAKTVVNKRFLLGLADQIHNPKKGTFLRLCNGSLQNGPDPQNKRRTMHCGLGELYFAMTGRHPETDGVSEAIVVDTAVDRSTVILDEELEERARKALKASGITGIDVSVDDGTPEGNFREALDDIQNANDEGPEDDYCDDKGYTARAKRVAAQLRKAAGYLRS